MIQFGNDKIIEIYHGSDKIKEIYHGSDLVWSGAKPSYAILTDDTRVDFELENTPMSNFQVSTNTVTINGTSYSKSLIKEIYFGSSYENVTRIRDNFLRNCTSLASVDLSVFVNVTSIGHSFLYYCTSLTSVDLSAFRKVNSIDYYFISNCNNITSIDLSGLVNVTSIGNSFMTNCPNITFVDLINSTKIENIGVGFLERCASLTALCIGTIVPPTIREQLFGSSPIQTIQVPAQSVNAYKTATNWKIHASKIYEIGDGYWVHKDTGVKRYFGLDVDFITGGIMDFPSWKFDCSEVKIPEGVTVVNDHCFYNSTSLTSITLPESLISIGYACFNYCTSLPSITIPESVTSLGGYCFMSCTSLILATVLPATPPSLGTDAFRNVHESFNIKVRSPYVNDYKTATNWVAYAAIISAI